MDADYNKLFALAQRAKLIPENITLRQTKRAMLTQARMLTDERFGPEWEEVRRETRKEYHFHPDVLKMKLRMLGYGLLMIFPLPLIPGLPWFFLCLTLGAWGARFKPKAAFPLFAASAVVMTLVWLYFSVYSGGRWNYGGWRVNYLWSLAGIAVFLAIWALIGSIMGKRLYKYAAGYSKEKLLLISLLFLSGIILTMPFTFFRRRLYYCFWPAENLIFKNYAFVSYFIAIGIVILCDVWFFDLQELP